MPGMNNLVLIHAIVNTNAGVSRGFLQAQIALFPNRYFLQEGMTVEELLSRYVDGARQQWDANTLGNARHIIADYIVPYIGSVPVANVNPMMLQSYYNDLLEGAGGLMVPLTTELLTIDYIVQEKYPLIFVTSGKLGSINHTLLSLEAIQKRGIVLDTVLYNLYPTVEDKTIQNDTMEFIRTWLKKYFPETKFILVPEIKKNL